MTDFEFDPTPSPGTNRAAAITDCATCGGDRMIPAEGDPHGPYERCPSCNPGPSTARPAVPVDSWWKE